jgi:hypothetical protein
MKKEPAAHSRLISMVNLSKGDGTTNSLQVAIICNYVILLIKNWSLHFLLYIQQHCASNNVTVQTSA